MKKTTAGDYTPQTFSQRYKALPSKASAPKSVFVREISELCMCSTQTVRMWIHGVQKPDALKQKLISEYLGAPAEELFPVESKA